MRTHTRIGFEILDEARPLPRRTRGLLHRHENSTAAATWSGARRYDIALGSRIVLVADAFNAIDAQRGCPAGRFRSGARSRSTGRRREDTSTPSPSTHPRSLRSSTDVDDELRRRSDRDCLAASSASRSSSSSSGSRRAGATASLFEEALQALGELRVRRFWLAFAAITLAGGHSLPSEVCPGRHRTVSRIACWLLSWGMMIGMPFQNCRVRSSRSSLRSHLPDLVTIIANGGLMPVTEGATPRRRTRHRP